MSKTDEVLSELPKTSSQAQNYEKLAISAFQVLVPYFGVRKKEKKDK